MSDNSRILLILDIDEVLVFSSTSPLDFNFRIDDYKTVKRPYLEEFIRCVFQWFNVAIWTAATEDYAQEVIQQVIPDPSLLKFVWGRKRCAFRYDYDKGDYYWIKDLKKVKRLGYRLERVLVLEDEYRSMKRSYGNLILIKSFEGNSKDSELQMLLKYLNWIRNADNVRNIEKRIWRNFERTLTE